ncbi:biotin carboxyl carrier protein of acetyl-CoA carboxylase, chloroplastic isoform X1 [Corylus avellana]|uniref:biotin carboxyl carrier protein of acetyl-CoA carboxylase, chloroplastic isoform X1 n=1 Tax=Corylus avellana TaxID=13451 RepID=UPI00286A7C1E|nr:biotin carboxyl carrier protein of acetyl-CoA carboxylase, chloroplastic isoform X1 [Corylus avellana]
MASSLASASASASAVSKASATSPRFNNNYTLSNLSFPLTPKPRLRLLTKGLQPSQNHSIIVKAQMNEVRFFQMFSMKDLFSNIHSFLDMLLASSFGFKVGVDGSSNAAATPPTKSEAVAPEAKAAKPSNDPSSGALATDESIPEFIAQVSSLVKLVDSRDIVELQLKQLDCEVLIRKKEALPQPPPPAPVTWMHSHVQSGAPPAQPVPAPAPAPALAPAAPTPSPSTSSSAVKSAKSSLPPLKCPMAGTFYRSSAPGEPPFVKVGDKVQKGQVLCIIEAMKLMNEIEADQSGTIVEILVEDGKPVSVDLPMFVIKP